MTVPRPEAADRPSVDASVALIRALVPLGLQKVGEELAEEVDRLAGPWYARDGADPQVVRWGQQAGSVYLADQKVPVLVPRVRNRVTGEEVRLEAHDLVVVLLDGKTFAEDEMVVAVGVTVTGEKVVLGLGQTATENRRVCAAFLRESLERGLQAPRGLLVITDGAKGLHAAVREVFGAAAQL